MQEYSFVLQVLLKDASMHWYIDAVFAKLARDSSSNAIYMRYFIDYNDESDIYH